MTVAMKSTSMKVRLFAASAILSTLAGTGLLMPQLNADSSVEPLVATVSLDTTVASESNVQPETIVATQGASIAAPTTGDFSGLFGVLSYLMGFFEALEAFILAITGG